METQKYSSGKNATLTNKVDLYFTSDQLFIKPRGQNFRITPHINYAYIHRLKKTNDRTILSLWDFSYCFRKK